MPSAITRTNATFSSMSNAQSRPSSSRQKIHVQNSSMPIDETPAGTSQPMSATVGDERSIFTPRGECDLGSPNERAVECGQLERPGGVADQSAESEKDRSECEAADGAART